MNAIYQKLAAGSKAREPHAGTEGAVLPEFGRWQDVQRQFGIKRGTLYRLIADGKIRSITLREPGRKFGCRLIHLQSVREHLHALMAKQTISEVL